MSDKIRWAVLGGDTEEHGRFTLLSAALKSAGLENEVCFVSADEDSLLTVVRNHEREGIGQFRLLGKLSEAAPRVFENVPGTMLMLKNADALVRGIEGRLWPRNFLYEAFTQIVAEDLRGLDFVEGAFVNGANSAARTVIAALVRTGFRRFNLTDADEDLAKRFLEDLRSTFFNIQFQFTRRSAVTQLAGIHSIAVNTTSADSDSTQLNELYYFNFLKAGGTWVEIPLAKANGALVNEARSVGAKVVPAERVNSLWDFVWAKSCLGVSLDLVAYQQALLP